MVELYAFMSILGLGYLLSKTNKEPERRDTQLGTSEIPTSNTMYDSSFAEAVKKMEIMKGQASFKKAEHPVETGVIGSQFRENRSRSVKKTITSNLAGIEIPADDFVHSNMQPFFGGSVKQNMNPMANRGTLERFTGEIESDIYIKKKECKPLFDLENNIGNVYGNPVQTELIKDRYNESRIRNNERPFEPVHVGPGINDGYSSQPTGGYQQFDAQEMIMPRTVDQLRTGSNPKETYEGRVLTGMGTAQRGKIGAVAKNKAVSFFENSPDRYFTTTGAQIKDTERPEYDAKSTNRQSTTKEYKGDLYAAGFSKAPPVDGAVKQTTRQQFEDFGFRNVDADEYGKGEQYDFGKGNILCKENERDLTVEKTYEGNLVSLVKSIIAPLEDIFKNSRKEYTIQNQRPYGQLQATFPPKITVKDPNDVTRTTIKETNIHDAVESGNIKGPTKILVYDPDEIARTTMREATRPMDTELNIRGGTYKGTIPMDDKANVTTKETLIDGERYGNIEGLEKVVGAYQTTEYDAKTTQKEFISDRDYIGGADKENGDGYRIAPDVAPATQKEFISDNDYFGVAEAAADAKKQMSYEDIMNATMNELREGTLVGRNPTKESVKVAAGLDSMNTYTRKLEIDNIIERENNNIEHIMNQKTTCPEDITITKEKDQLENDDRLDINLLSALQNNPYAIKPLSSV
jgi:hypothetical protein